MVWIMLTHNFIDTIYLSTLLFTQYISNTGPFTKHHLPTHNLFQHSLGGLRAIYPYLFLNDHFTMSKKLHLNIILTPFNYTISFQLYQKYLLESTLLFTQCILTLVHPLNTIYKIIYSSMTSLGGLRSTYPIIVSKWFKLLNYICHFNCIKNIYLTQLYLFTQYILTPVHPLNTIYQIIYFNILWVCRLLVYTCKPLLYTCKPLLYTKKFERKVLPPQCPAKLWEQQL